MKKYSNYIFYFSFLITFSCNNPPEEIKNNITSEQDTSGVELTPHVDFYDNGVLKTSFHTLNGEMHGKVLMNYESGHKKIEEIYKKGKKEGIMKVWYPSGKLKYRANYKNDSIHGEVVFFHENGKKKNIGQMSRGKKEGAWKWYDEDGQLIKIGQFHDDKRVGEWIFYEDGEQIDSTNG